MGQLLMDRCLSVSRGAVAALVLFARAAAADATPPQLINFSISPLSVDTSSGPATLNVSISAQDISNGFGANAAGNGSLSLALQSGTTVFSRQSLPITGGSSTNPVFQFAFTLPQFSPPGNYAIGITLVDNASNTSIFDAARLQAMGFPSIITVTDSAFGSITLSPSSASVPASGGLGSISVTASNSGFAWSAASNASWLTITSGTSGTGNGTIAYQAAANNAPAARTGTITANGQTFTATQAAASSALNTTTGSLQFAYQIGGAAPPPQNITAFSSGAPLNFTATAASVGNWLFVSPSNGVTSTVLSIFVNPIGLSAGVYSGTVTVAAGGSSNGSQTEAVTLVVSASPTVTVTPGALSFSYQQGGSAAPPQSLLVSSGATTSFTASAASVGGWLGVNPTSAATTSAVVVSVFPSGLAPGSYGGSVSISTAAGVQNIPVTLVVTAPSTVAVSPSSLTFSYSIGGAIPPAQSLLFSGGSSSPSFSATASSAGNWLALGSSISPGGVSVSVNPTGLGAGVYSGTVTVTESGGSPQSVPVTLVVSASQGFSVSPSSLAFSVASGAAPRRTQALTVAAADPNARFTAVASGNTNGSAWLSLDTAGSFPAGQLGVVVDSSILQPGNYTGSVTINGPNASQIVPVTVSVGAAAALTVAPTALAFSYQQGSAFPASQTVSVGSNGQGAAFSVSAATVSGWLFVAPSTGFTPGSLTVSVVPSGLNPGTYSGAIVVSATGLAGNAQSIPVSLMVNGPSIVTVSPANFQINYQVGDPNPTPPTFLLTGQSSTFTASASSSGNWLSVSPTSGIAPATLTALVSPSGLGPGTYTGLIQVFPAGSPMQTITITLNVHAAQNLSLNPNSLSFTYQAGGAAAAPQNITVACASSALSFRPVASSTGNWLSVAVPNGQGNNQIVVSVSPAGLAPGSYAGTITIFGVGACNTSQTVPVTLLVSGGSQSLTVSAGSVAFSYQTGNSIPAAQAISLGCGGAVSFFTVSSNSGWLRVSPASGSLPAVLSISVDPTGLASGSNTGILSIAASGACAGNQNVSVSLLVTAAQPAIAPVLTFSAGSLSFSATAGAPSPAQQSVSIACSGAAGQFLATATSNGGWLSVSPFSGNTPAALIVSVNSIGLAAGSYSGSVSASSAACGATPVLPVTVTVSAAPGPVPSPVLTITPSSLAFTYQTGSVNPFDQTISLGGSAGQIFTATASSSGWLAVSPPGAATPANLTVAVNPSALVAGTYSGVILIATNSGSTGTSQSVAVTLTVSTAAAPPIVIPIPNISSLVNAASLLATPLAPGEIISFFGRGLGPVESAQFRLTPSGLIDNSLVGTRVIVDGAPAPIVYTQAGQVNAIVPYSVAGKSTVQVMVEYQGVRSAPASFAVAAASPAIFTIDGSGHGQGAILDQDTSVNSDLNPADRGSIMVLYATGAGQMDPAGIDGAITGRDLARPLAAVSVLVDGQDTEILYAGAAPGLVAGALQVNFRLPPQVRTGAAIGVLLKVGRFTSQPGVTLAIR